MELIGLKFPLSKEYISAIENLTYGAEEVFKKYRLPIFDYEKIFIEEPEYFENQDHLNELGGSELVEKIFN